MRALRCVLAIAFVLALPMSASAQDADGASDGASSPIARLHWVHGPSKASLFGLANFEVPSGYMFLDQAETKKFMTLTQNPASGSEYLFGPEDLHWFGVFTFADDGFVRDDDAIDAPALLKSISEGTEAGNEERRRKGWPEMHVLGWKKSPAYDTDTKRLEWAIDGKDSANAEVVNYNVRILGRTGVTSALLVVDPNTIDTSVAEFKTALHSYDYASGQHYAEFREGDKVAEYGLAALVAGGAAAVAAKTGFWKTIVVALAAAWKFVIAGVLAVFASIGKLFRRKAR